MVICISLMPKIMLSSAPTQKRNILLATPSESVSSPPILTERFWILSWFKFIKIFCNASILKETVILLLRYGNRFIKGDGEQTRNAVATHGDAVDHAGAGHGFSVVGYEDELGSFRETLYHVSVFF